MRWNKPFDFTQILQIATLKGFFLDSLYCISLRLTTNKHSCEPRFVLLYYSLCWLFSGVRWLININCIN